jgi:hypothetical protein
LHAKSRRFSPQAPRTVHSGKIMPGWVPPAKRILYNNYNIIYKKMSD